MKTKKNKINLFLLLLTFCSITNYAQKFKHEKLVFKAQHHPGEPLKGNVSEMNIQVNIINPNNQYKGEINSEVLISKIFKFDSIKVGSNSSDYTIEFNLNTSAPMISSKSMSNSPILNYFEFQSTYIIKDKKGFKFSEGKIAYDWDKKYAEPYTSHSDGSPNMNIERQFRGLAQIINSKYDFVIFSEVIELCKFKDDGLKRMTELNDSLEQELKGVVIKFNRNYNSPLLQRAIAYNQSLIDNTDKNNKDLENIIFAAHSNLINLYTLLGDYDKAASYIGYIDDSKHGGGGKQSAKGYYNKVKKELDDYNYKVGNSTENPNKGIFGLEIETPTVNDKDYKKGFIIKPENLTDTITGRFENPEMASNSLSVTFAADKEGAVKENFKSEQLSYYFVDGLMYKSLKQETGNKTVIGKIDNATLNNRNTFVPLYYESDLIFFGVIHKNGQPRYLLINKNNDTRDDLLVPGDNSIVFPKQIKKFFEKCFNQDERLKSFLDNYDFKTKYVFEFFEVINKIEELYGKGSDEYTRIMNKLSGLPLKYK